MSKEIYLCYLLQVWFSYIYLESELILWVFLFFCEKLDFIFQVKKVRCITIIFMGKSSLFKQIKKYIK